MTLPVRNSLLAVNILSPLVCGLFIYLTKAERTYIADFLQSVRLALPSINYPYLIRYYACDFLWTYSLFFCFRLTTGNMRTSILLTGFIALILETMQIMNAVPGTFDLYDIDVEIIAIAVAFGVMNLIERRFNKHEEK